MAAYYNEIEPYAAEWLRNLHPWNSTGEPDQSSKPNKGKQ